MESLRDVDYVYVMNPLIHGDDTAIDFIDHARRKYISENGDLPKGVIAFGNGGDRTETTTPDMVIRKIFKYSRIMDIEKLVKEFPNDMELGKAVREIYLRREKILEEHKDIKIFESPDKGKTVYVRGWGESSSTRKKVTNQLNIFE